MSDQSDINLPPVPRAADGSTPPADPLPPQSSPVAAADAVASDAPSDAPAPVPPVPPAPYVPPAQAEFGQRSGPAYARPDDSVWQQTWRILSARFKSLSEHAGRRLTQRTLKIGVSARIFHPQTGAKGLQAKTLQYLEESIAQWVMSRDVLVLMIPTVNTNGMLHPSKIRLRDYAKHLDGLVLQGGADVAPQTYSQTATRPEWIGDSARDMYELELLHEFIEAGKPVLGICRGCQLINVAFGGTLYQDIATDVPEANPHVHETYDSHRHRIQFPSGSSLGAMFAAHKSPLVNSIHHQAVRDLGRDLMIEAVSEGDNIVEAVRHTKSRFVMGLQWHPEFHRAGGADLLDCTPILDNFLRAARDTRF